MDLNNHSRRSLGKQHFQTKVADKAFLVCDIISTPIPMVPKYLISSPNHVFFWGG